MEHSRDAFRRHNNPIVWVLVVLLIWYTYPAFTEWEREHDRTSTPE